MLPYMEQKKDELFKYDFENFSFPAHFHSGLEILYVTSGEIELTVGSSVFPVQKDFLALIFPGLVHSYSSPASFNNGKIIIIGQRLLSEYSTEFSDFYPKNPVLDFFHPDCLTAFLALCELIHSEERTQKAYASVFAARVLPSLTLFPRSNPDDKLLYSLIRYMERHFTENISLSDVADALYTSKYNVSRAFSGSVKMNFNDYLNALRVNRALHLLKTTSSSISQIAMDCGFSSIRTFNRAFKKQTGHTPGKMRGR